MSTTREPTDEDRAFTEMALEGADEGDDRPGASLRRDARRRLKSLGLPHSKDEAWRFVNLRPLKGTDFAAPEAVDGELTDEMVEAWSFPESEGRRLVFVNGSYAPQFSDTSGFGDGVRAGRIAEPSEGADEVAEAFGKPGRVFSEDYFANLNTAGYRDGAYVIVPPNTSVDGVVHLLHLSTESADPYLAHPRNLVVAGRGSKVSVVEDYGGPAGGTYFNNTFTEVSVADSARVDHVKVQGESPDAYHIGRTAVDLDDHGVYNSKTIAYGAKFSRFDVHARGDGEQIDCTLDGLAVLEDEQVSDTHSAMDHREGHAGSHQLHKMILDDDAHSVFNGKIFVQPHAQKIDAYQLNQSLLLSPRAKVNTKPQLEIFADDVSCTHGATIGQLEDEQLFYLRARGLDYDEARELLIYGFAAEIIETIPIEGVRERLAETIARKTRKQARE